MNSNIWKAITILIIAIGLGLGIKFFSEETQNNISRSIGTMIGYKNGQVEIYVGQSKAVQTFFKVEKLSTAIATNGNEPRPYRFGFGYRDINHNDILDPEEIKLGKKYFEVPNYAQYVYFDN